MNKEPEEVKRIQSDRPWVCPGCKAILGFTGMGGREIRIKYKDLYVMVEGGKVSRPCRKCGRMNTIMDDDYIEYLQIKYQEATNIE